METERCWEAVWRQALPAPLAALSFPLRDCEEGRLTLGSVSGLLCWSRAGLPEAFGRAVEVFFEPFVFFRAGIGDSDDLAEAVRPVAAAAAGLGCEAGAEEAFGRTVGVFFGPFVFCRAGVGDSGELAAAVRPVAAAAAGLGCEAGADDCCEVRRLVRVSLAPFVAGVRGESAGLPCVDLRSRG
jgi:hypothetical protein